jgi:TrpR family transcriptional regulator, trp operon repressor
MEDRELIAVFASINDRATMRKFFREIFTRSEIADLSLRWRLMRMLKDGMPQRRIAGELGVSLCKITRGARLIKDESTITNRYIKPTVARRKHAG